MAGQRMYYTGPLTSTKGAVLVSARIQLNGAPGVAGTRVLSGPGFSIVSVQAGGTPGVNNSVTVQFPEKYGVCNLLEVQEVQSSATDGTYACVQTDYNPATGRATFQVGSATGATFAGASSPNVTLYVRGEFQLGM